MDDLHADAAAGTFRRSQKAAEQVATRTIHANLGRERGAPDRLFLAADDNVFVAMFGGGCVIRLDPNGAVTERITTPVAQVTACTIDPTGRSLFITTSDYGVEPADRSVHGSVFRAEIGEVTDEH